MLNNIRSAYILRYVFENIKEIKSLKLAINNKSLQQKLYISLVSYIRYHNQTEIEIIPTDNIGDKEKNIFMNYSNEPKFYHIFFDDKKVDRNYISKNEKVSKIKIYIDMEIESLEKIFEKINCIKEIKFIKYNNPNIKIINRMFLDCKNLSKLRYIQT